MQIRKLNRIEKIQYELKRKREEFKRSTALLKAKLLKENLPADDDKTIQLHKDSQGLTGNYYISNSYLQNRRNMAYRNVNLILEDNKNGRYVYTGTVQEPYCAIGVIETNLRLDEIVASPEGNLVFEQFISEENTKKACEDYYQKIGETLMPVREEMSSFLGKPKFVLGSIYKLDNGKFTVSQSVSDDIEQMLETEREESKRMALMREKDSVEIEIGSDIIVSEQDCWLQQSKNMKFVGINQEALYYEYSPGKPEKTADGKYVYMGDLKIGKSRVVNKGSQEPLQFVKAFNMEDVVFCTNGKNLIEYFLQNKLDGLNFELGKAFSVSNLKKRREKDGITYLGILGLDEEGNCIIREDEIPENVQIAINNIKARSQENTSEKIVPFEPN